MLEPQLEQALAFPAPFVIDRLVKDRVTDTPAEAELLFTEAKRYLVLCEATPQKSFGMHSAVVDQAWHAFILFTAEYTDFGNRFFGGYVHHSPVVDHDSAAQPGPNAGSFNDFQSRYEELFGQPLPAVWYDDTSVAPSRRVISARAGTLTVDAADDTVELINDTGDSVLSVNALAREAVDFIAHHPDFYVRELPGGLTDDEKVGLIQPLVRTGVLRMAQ
ncbi:glycine-rich domain-containing protein [Mycolicibacterium sp. Dal123E01]|uniref:glycine-rich domain-containing protein n=1 Tax=Mycolicibacterium sp. Dal123E01 TaxID=3457578 RepID=UPI00403E419E